jgi:hypothetical protein
MREYYIHIKWTCDYCGYVEDLSDVATNQRSLDYAIQEIKYPPDGWIRRINEPEKHYHTEECLKATMSPEELDEFNKSVWIG